MYVHIISWHSVCYIMTPLLGTLYDLAELFQLKAGTTGRHMEGPKWRFSIGFSVGEPHIVQYPDISTDVQYHFST